MENIKPIIAIIIIFAFLTTCTKKNKEESKEAKIWTTYKTAKENGNNSPILDYSYAGYANGEKAIPETLKLDYPIFKVTDFGAVANDTIADDLAIQKAIAAAEQEGKGIVLFSKGRYIINKGENFRGFEINQSNIIIKGAGAGKNGTEIFMQDYMRYDKNISKWTSPFMFTFKPEGLDIDAFCSTNVSKRPYRTKVKVIEKSKEGSFSIVVENATQFKNQSHLILVMPYNRESMQDFMGDLKTRPQWERINKKGITANEIHKIKSIIGNTITFYTPLLTDIKPAYNWFVAPHKVIEECGFEDIHFVGNFQEKFVHHKNKIHDGGWKAVSMAHVANSWIRRCVFTNVSNAVKITGSSSSSVIMNIIDGKQGHSSTEMTFGSFNLTGLWLDKTDVGQWHGIDASHMAAGNVAWRISAPQGRGFDLHSGYTRATLYDCYEAYLMSGNGGNYKVEPHHLKGFTLWNFKQTGPAVKDYDYWSMKPKQKGKDSMYWGFAVAQPTIVGFYGSKTTFVKESLGYAESIGEKVFPESLYEAQLGHRLEKRPQWINKTLKEWELWKTKVIK